MTAETMDARLAREKAEWRAEVEALRVALGGDWRHPEDGEMSNSGYWTLTSAALRVRLYLRSQRDRLDVSVGIHPAIGLSEWAPNGPDSITVARSKSPERIAADIERRILRDVPAWVHVTQKRDEEWRTQARAIAESAQACAEACDGSARVKRDPDGSYQPEHNYRPGDGLGISAMPQGRESYISGTVFGGDGVFVNMELRRVPVVEALALLKLWRKMAPAVKR